MNNSNLHNNVICSVDNLAFHRNTDIALIFPISAQMTSTAPAYLSLGDTPFSPFVLLATLVPQYAGGGPLYASHTKEETSS